MAVILQNRKTGKQSTFKNMEDAKDCMDKHRGCFIIAEATGTSAEAKKVAEDATADAKASQKKAGKEK